MPVGQALGVWDKAVVISIEQNSLHYKEGNYIILQQEAITVYSAILVSSPDPTLSWGEMVWWTESNFLGWALFCDNVT